MPAKTSSTAPHPAAGCPACGGGGGPPAWGGACRGNGGRRRGPSGPPAPGPQARHRGRGQASRGQRGPPRVPRGGHGAGFLLTLPSPCISPCLSSPRTQAGRGFWRKDLRRSLRLAKVGRKSVGGCAMGCGSGCGRRRGRVPQARGKAGTRASLSGSDAQPCGQLLTFAGPLGGLPAVWRKRRRNRGQGVIHSGRRGRREVSSERARRPGGEGKQID